MALINRILVPVDFSAGSRAALRYAASIAEKFDASIEAFHVWEPLPYVAPSQMVWMGSEPDEFWKQYKVAAEERLSLLVRTEVPAAAERVALRVEAGYPSGSILDRLDTEAFDMVVMGTRGLTGLKHLLLGSVAERVVQRAKCPVLTLHAPPKEEEGEEGAGKSA